MENEKLEQLAEMLGIEAEQIEVSESENEFFTPKGTYLVMDEDEAITANYETVKEVFDDLGISSFAESFQQEIKQDYIDNDSLEEWLYDYEKSFACEIRDETSEEYADRLVEESIERGYISKSQLSEDNDYNGEYDLADLYAERCIEDYKGNYDSLADYIETEYGRDFLNDMVKKNPSLIDLEEIASRVAELDGYGHLIASWDGATNETADFYAFKQSDSDERTQDFLNELEDTDLEY